MSDTLATIVMTARHLCVTIKLCLALHFAVVKPSLVQISAQGSCGFPVILIHPNLSLTVHYLIRGISCNIRPFSYT